MNTNCSVRRYRNNIYLKLKLLRTLTIAISRPSDGLILIPDSPLFSAKESGSRIDRGISTDYSTPINLVEKTIHLAS